MSQNVFQVIEHTIPAQHIREYPNGSKNGEASLQLAIKEYRPLDNLDAPPGSVTLIGAHAIGCPKECYEALWEDLYHALKDKSSIRAIWIADVSNHGASGILNEKVQGDDPSWFDHSRDLLHMTNHFRDSMPQPIMGVAHSMGSAQLVHLSMLHSRLFHSLALIEPVIQDAAPQGPNVAFPSSYRPDFWPSRDDAEAATRKAKYFRSWDPRVFKKFLGFGLRPTPTAIYPGPEHEGGVTLATTKHQEAWSYIRPNFSPMAANREDRSERLQAPDLSSEDRTHLFTKPEMYLTNQSLPHVRPHVLWIFGEKSPINTPGGRDDKLKRTGTGVGGNGGASAGQVEAITLPDGQHMLPLEKTPEVAELLATWLEKQLRDYREVEEWYRANPSGKSDRDMLVLSKAWMKNIRQKESTPRSVREKL
ncbi:Abhydrolase domain-containing protein mpaH [Lachnellula suecica]|uniref:Abhydrolase domain-containing protein mpaH n=1 Tax=Lachnellula suecica TaxID=602035 RepID=A0A8T9C1C9_9HELO|nr:Abhydrolase domain-containing protein mpaH [Lachnellula suecica]